MIVRPDPRDRFLALTVRQPAASQIASGEKREEYRTWATQYRGDLLITASARKPPGGGSEPLGCAICVVEVVDMIESPDDWAWVLANPRAVPNVPIKGRLSLWEVPETLLKQLGLKVKR